MEGSTLRSTRRGIESELANPTPRIVYSSLFSTARFSLFLWYEKGSFHRNHTIGGSVCADGAFCGYRRRAECREFY